MAISVATRWLTGACPGIAETLAPGRRGWPGRKIRSGLLAAGLATVVFSGAAFGRPAPVAAAVGQSNLSYISTSTWTADPSASMVHVDVKVSATSHASVVNGLQTFYDTLQLTLPASITDLAATDLGGKPLPISIDAQLQFGNAVSVGLGRKLYDGDSQLLDIRFDLIDKGSATDRDLRLGTNLVSFPVTAFGSPGAQGSSVTVIFPSGFNISEEFGGLTRSTSGPDEVEFTSGILSDSTKVSAWFTAVRPVPAIDFSTRLLKLDQLDVTLRYWTSDPGWADQVARVLSLGLPALSNLIGLGSPTARTLTVVEASNQEINGFSGQYDQTSGQIQVSYFADPFVILHETAHLWFNEDLTSERWIAEGFASFYAEQAVTSLGFVDHAPVLSDRLTEAAVPFNSWNVTSAPTSATDAYLYGATLGVARQIAHQAGMEGLRLVWQMARGGFAAYQPAHGQRTDLVSSKPIDWRRFLDLLERTTGSSFEALWKEWVVDPSQAPELARHTTSIAAYTSVVGLAGAWNLPPALRRALDDWDFPAALYQIEQTKALLADRDQIVAQAGLEQTEPPATLRTVFEALSIESATAEAQSELDVLGQLRAAREAEAKGHPGGLALGPIGSDPVEDLAAARVAFAQGDLARAAALAANARFAWEGGTTAGLVRLIGVLVGLVGLLLLLVVLVWIRRGRGGPLPGTAKLEATIAGVYIRAAHHASFRRFWRQARARLREGLEAVGRARDRFIREIVRPARKPAESGGPDGPLAGVGPERGPGDRSGGPPIKAGNGRTGNGRASELGFAYDFADAPARQRKAGEKSSSGGRAARGEARRHERAAEVEVDRPEVGRPAVGRPEVDRPEVEVGSPVAGPTTDATPELASAGALAANHEPDREDAYYLLQRGQELLRGRHNAQAAVVLARAARVEPGKGSILEALGRAYFNSGQHARAAEAFAALLEVDPSAHYGHFGLGLSFARLGRRREARKHLRLAVALDPSSETYREALEKVEATTA